MPPPAATPPSPAPAEHQAFLHRLAVGLVQDEHLADDLVQEAWLSALSRPDGGTGLGRGWFAKALRHLSFNRRLADRSRASREWHAAAPAFVDAIEVDERLGKQALVLDAVRRLPEVLRTVIYLRYFEELGPTAIAAKTGTSLATVKSRVARARELLRRDLGRGGDEAAWLSAIVPILTLSPERSAPWAGAGTILGALTMSGIGKAAITTALILGAAFVWRGAGVERKGPRPPEGTLAAASEGPDSLDKAPTPEAGRTRVSRSPDEAVPEPGVETAAAAAPVGRTLTGRLIDPEGRPLSDVAVALIPRRTHGSTRDSRRAVSSGDGSFRLEAPATSGELVVDSDQLVTLFSALVGPTTAREAIVIAARRAPLAGRVVDETGVPLAGAEVTAVLPDGFRRRIPYVMDNCFLTPHRSVTDAQGRFEIENGSRVEGAFLQTSLEGYVTRRDPLASLDPDARLVLRRPGTTEDALFGLVLDERGRPVEGARVSFGAEVTSTDASGSFELLRTSGDRAYAQLRDLAGAESRTLCAVAPHCLPACLEVPLAPDGARPDWPDGVVLQLTGHPLEISGRVVDPAGTPLPDIRVFLEEATLFTMTDGATSIENLLGGDPEERITMFVTGPRGEFTIGGLQDRTYPLVAFHWGTAVQTHTQPIPAGGPPVEIVLDVENVWHEVNGRVLSPQGEPLGGVDVHVFTDATDFFFEGRFARTSNMLVSSCVSDEEGRFRLSDVPKDHVYLFLMGDEIIVTPFGMDEPLGDRGRPSLAGLELVVSRRAHVQVTLEVPGEADEIELLDETGQALEMRVHQGKPGAPRRRMPFYGPQTDVLAVDEAARTLLYYKEGAVLRRRPVTLHVGRLNEL